MRNLIAASTVLLLALAGQGPAGADESVAMEGEGAGLRGVISRGSTSPGGATAVPRAVIGFDSEDAPAPAPRITRTKRGVTYDYTPVGGGHVRYVFDPSRDHCQIHDVRTTCYGPAPPPARPGQPVRRRPAPPPPITPQEIVERTIVSMRLPSPQPEIAPGYAITGLRAYLETGNDTTHTFAPIPTVLGPLHVTARSTYTVDWGDGTVTGPHDSTGGPYPDGTITHVYQHRAVVDVQVMQSWMAHWRLAGHAGTVNGLRSSGTIDNFSVREVQAVRQR